MTFPPTGCDLPLTRDFLLFVVGNSKIQYAKMFKYLGHYTWSSRTWLMMSTYSRKSVIGLFIRTNILYRKFHNSSTHVKKSAFKSYVICYRQHCAQRKAPIFQLLRGRFWCFSPHKGNSLHRWRWNSAWTAMLNFTPSVQRYGYRTPKLNFLLNFLFGI